MKILSVSTAAERLGVTPRRVIALIQAERLPATQLGREWAIREADLKMVEHRKPGRPPKTESKKRGAKR